MEAHRFLTLDILSGLFLFGVYADNEKAEQSVTGILAIRKIIDGK